MRTFLTRILVVMAAVLTSAAITSCVYDDPKQEEFELAPGDRIPDFSVKLTSVHHIAVINSNYEKTYDFYVNRLGFIWGSSLVLIGWFDYSKTGG